MGVEGELGLGAGLDVEVGHVVGRGVEGLGARLREQRLREEDLDGLAGEGARQELVHLQRGGLLVEDEHDAVEERERRVVQAAVLELRELAVEELRLQQLRPAAGEVLRGHVCDEDLSFGRGVEHGGGERW